MLGHYIFDTSVVYSFAGYPVLYTNIPKTFKNNENFGYFCI